MSEKIIEMLHKSGIRTKKIIIGNSEVNLISTGEKVIFLKFVSESLDCVFDLCNDIAENYTKDINSFINNINAEDDSGVVDKLNLKQVLWDLYIIAVKIDLPENQFDIGLKSKFERNTFIARKILIQFDNNEEIVDEIIKNVSPNNALEKHLNTPVVKNTEDTDVKKIMGRMINDNPKTTNVVKFDHILDLLSSFKE